MGSRYRLTFHALQLVTFCAIMIFATCPASFARDINVSKQNGTLDPSCWNSTDTTQPCGTLALALEGLKHYGNQTTVWIESGTYTLNSSANGDSNEWKYSGMSDIAIVGFVPGESDHDLYTDATPVQIECEGGAGLSFFYSNNVTIRGVELVGCGALHQSTSRNFTIDSYHVFAKFRTALYFLFCRDVVLEHVTIANSSGIGAVIYSTVGNNLIQNCNFAHNTADSENDSMHELPGGGGLYIEFSYCSPHVSNEAEDCNSTNVPFEYVTDSNFTISSCTFRENVATLLHPEEHTFILPQLSNHLAFGRGGGISVFFKGNATNNRVFISNSILKNNHALWGAGMFVEYQDLSNHNQLIMESSFFDSNECDNYDSEKSGTGGGGARIGYIFFDPTHSHDNNMTFKNVIFINNRAYYGGGLSFYVARESGEATPTNGLTFDHCVWDSNFARVGSAADISVWHPVHFGAIVQPCFIACSFQNNTARYTSLQGSFVGIGALYVDSVPVSFRDYVHFEDNHQSALASVSTGIYFEDGCSAQFLNNRGRNGGAIALMGYSFIEVSNGTNLTFTNNTAEIKGGAIYGQSIGEHDLISSRNCFIRYKNISATPNEWNSKFFFSNNGIATPSGNKSSNSIFVTSLLTCLWGGAFGSTNSSTKDVFCWNNGTEYEDRWNYDNGDCDDEIATSAAKFSSNNTDIDSDFTMRAIPGKTEKLPFSIADDREIDVTDKTVLIATAKTPDKMYIDSSSLYISDNHIKLHGVPNANASDPRTLRLETTGPRVISTIVEVTMVSCPPGLILDPKNMICKCEGDYGGLVKCDGVNFSSKIQRSSWMGYWPSENKTLNETVFAGQCPYCALITDERYLNMLFTGETNTSLEEYLDETFCGNISRTGVLCGACIDNYGPVVNSEYFECVPCPPSKARYGWFLYLLTEFLPITIFFFIVILFNVSATSGPANAYVFFAQVLTTVFKIDGDGSIQLDDISKYPKVIKSFYEIPYDIWNLNFFRPILPTFCLSSDISTLQLLSTGYITAFYPLLLVGIFYTIVRMYAMGLRPVVLIFRPLHACFARFRSIWNIQRSVLHALATFILLSYTKFTLVSFILLTATPLYNNTGETFKSVVYYDGTIEFFKGSHIPYVVVSLIVIMTFVALPPIVLTVPSILHYVQKLSRRDLDLCGRCHLGPNWDQFLNAFHGCYKDGTGDEHGGDGNRHDYRWFAGLYFFLRLILFLVYAFTPFWFVQYVIQQLICMCAFAAFMVFRPYKNDFYNKVDAGVFALLSAISTLTMYNYFLTVTESDISKWAFSLQYVLILSPLIYIILFVFYNFCKNHKEKVMKVLRPLQTVNEDEENDNFIAHAEQSGRLSQRELIDSDSVVVAINRNRRAAEENLALLHNQEDERANSNSNESNEYGATASSATQTTIISLTDEPFGTGIQEMEYEEEKGKSSKRKLKLFHTH